MLLKLKSRPWMPLMLCVGRWSMLRPLQLTTVRLHSQVPQKECAVALNPLMQNAALKKRKTVKYESMVLLCFILIDLCSYKLLQTLVLHRIRTHPWVLRCPSWLKRRGQGHQYCQRMWRQGGSLSSSPIYKCPDYIHLT